MSDTQTSYDTATLPALGATPDASGTSFLVWAANAERVKVLLYDGDTVVAEHALAPQADGYFGGHIAGVASGARYAYRLDNGDPRPDPVSRSQPVDIHGPSEVVDPAAFPWTDSAWRGIPLADAIIYEFHVGTFTPEGTFDAAITRLDDIVELGVTAIEIMPVADFPGNHNWGYDGVSLWAPARAYGGAEGLRRLVDAAHSRGLAVIQDVVYNHLGPDGNYLSQFSKAYFTDHHKTPWGDALNFDTAGSAAVRAFFVGNACHWAREYHMDGLRLDATHTLKDDSKQHILTEIVEAVSAALPADRHFLAIAEDERNEAQLVRMIDHGGYGLDAVWADDMHHQVRSALAGDNEGYYADYSGSTQDLVATLKQGWFYQGQVSEFAGHPRGTPADDIAPEHFVHCIQNHDQVGNRALGERLNADIDPDEYRVASALLLLSPYTPMLWMGQEWAASSPFLFFTDHNAELGKLVTEGRRAEFKGFAAFAGEEVPDPQAPETFERSKLRWDERDAPEHAGTLELYRDLIALRRSLPAMRPQQRDEFSVAALSEDTLVIRYAGATPADALLAVVHLRGNASLDLTAQPETAAETPWHTLLDTEDPRYNGRGVATLDGARLPLDGPRVVLLAAGT